MQELPKAALRNSLSYVGICLSANLAQVASGRLPRAVFDMFTDVDGPLRQDELIATMEARTPGGDNGKPNGGVPGPGRGRGRGRGRGKAKAKAGGRPSKRPRTQQDPVGTAADEGEESEEEPGNDSEEES